MSNYHFIFPNNLCGAIYMFTFISSLPTFTLTSWALTLTSPLFRTHGFLLKPQCFSFDPAPVGCFHTPFSRLLSWFNVVKKQNPLNQKPSLLWDSLFFLMSVTQRSFVCFNPSGELVFAEFSLSHLLLTVTAFLLAFEMSPWLSSLSRATRVWSPPSSVSFPHSGYS